MYAGPLHDEPLAVELHNTRYVAGGERCDGLATQASTDAWLAAVLPGAGRVPAAALIEVREVIASALWATAGGDLPSAAVLEALNAASARAPTFPVVRRLGGALAPATDTGTATPEDVVVAACAADAIRLLTEPAPLHRCGAPGCVLLYRKAHPRQGWCSSACGNRARQARHYHRTRA